MVCKFTYVIIALALAGAELRSQEVQEHTCHPLQTKTAQAQGKHGMVRVGPDMITLNTWADTRGPQGPLNTVIWSKGRVAQNQAAAPTSSPFRHFPLDATGRTRIFGFFPPHKREPLTLGFISQFPEEQDAKRVDLSFAKVAEAKGPVSVEIIGTVKKDGDYLLATSVRMVVMTITGRQEKLWICLVNPQTGKTVEAKDYAPDHILYRRPSIQAGRTDGWGFINTRLSSAYHFPSGQLYEATPVSMPKFVTADGTVVGFGPTPFPLPAKRAVGYRHAQTKQPLDGTPKGTRVQLSWYNVKTKKLGELTFVAKKQPTLHYVGGSHLIAQVHGVETFLHWIDLAKGAITRTYFIPRSLELADGSHPAGAVFTLAGKDTMVLVVSKRTSHLPFGLAWE